MCKSTYDTILSNTRHKLATVKMLTHEFIITVTQRVRNSIQKTDVILDDQSHYFFYGLRTSLPK